MLTYQTMAIYHQTVSFSPRERVSFGIELTVCTENLIRKKYIAHKTRYLIDLSLYGNQIRRVRKKLTTAWQYKFFSRQSSADSVSV